jgi:iron-sulfur cluster repair protein YtfE (RIC family)
MADLLQQLEAEHRKAESLMDQLEEAEAPTEREALLSQLESALTEHMRKEEEIVYPVLAELDDEKAEQAEAEHNGARELLQKMRDGGVEQPGFGAVVSALKGAVGHHVEEEEGELFPKLRDEVGADRFRLDRDTAGTVDLTDMTKDELYRQATELGIEGRSAMNKDELAKAVASGGTRS